jgi:hypothetical protein
LRTTLLVEGGFVKPNRDRMSPSQAACYETVKRLGTNYKKACTCVSGWCEVNLYPLPNPVKEQIRDSGVTRYTSGSVPGKRKSGEGFSAKRGAWSIEKGVDTCGGFGERVTSGSAAQRSTLILADGPPTPLESCQVDSVSEGKPAWILTFVGNAESHAYPSIVNLEVKFVPAQRRPQLLSQAPTA